MAEVTTSILVWCIAGDLSTFPVEDVSATMTPDDDAGCSHFCTAGTASSVCSHHLSQCCCCWCSRESCAGSANEASSKARASFVVWLAAV